MRAAADNRDTILQSAAKLFARKAFHEVLMDDVAIDAGIAKGTVYRYFKNKDELFEALSLYYLDMLAGEIAAASRIAGAPLVRMRRMLLRLADLVREHHDFFQVLMRHECGLWDAREAEFSSRRNAIRDLFVHAVREAQATGELDVAFDPGAASDMILGMHRNIQRFTTPPPEPSQIADMIMHVLVHGFERKDARAG